MEKSKLEADLDNAQDPAQVLAACQIILAVGASPALFQEVAQRLSKAQANQPQDTQTDWLWLEAIAWKRAGELEKSRQLANKLTPRTQPEELLLKLLKAETVLSPELQEVYDTYQQDPGDERIYAWLSAHPQGSFFDSARLRYLKA